MSNEPTAPVPASPPAGWHPDPHDPQRWRYWDGAEWSAYGSADGLSVGAATGVERAAPSGAPVRERLLAMLASLIVIGAGIGYAFWSSGDEEPADSFAAVVEPATDTAPDEDDSSDRDESADPPDDEEWEDPLDDSDMGDEFASVGPLTIVYEIETNNGEVYEQTVASDGERSVLRNDVEFVYHGPDETITCYEGRCTSQQRRGANLVDAQALLSIVPSDNPSRSRIAGRDALCVEYPPSRYCIDAETGVLLLMDPGDAAMEPNAFTSERTTAIEVRPPDDDDFELPDGATVTPLEGDES